MSERLEKPKQEIETNKFGVSRKAFDKELIELRAELRKGAFGLGVREQDVDDLMQTALAKAVRYFDSYDPTASRKSEGGTQLGGWLYTIMQNEFMGQKRKENTQKRLREHPSYTLRNTPENHDMEIALEVKQGLALVPLLTPNFQAVLMLAAEEYSGDDMAEKLGINKITARTRLNKARAALRALYEQKGKGNEGNI